MRRTNQLRQRGFSMVEMLMAAFILGVGLLGLASLQVMSLRVARGGKSLTTAVLVAERIMDQVEQEGRLTWLNQTSATGPGAALTGMQFINAAAPVYVAVDNHGNTTAPSGTKPDLGGGSYVATVGRQDVNVTGPTGRTADYFVVVEFQDETDRNGAPITRTVSLTRRILHV
ncbi:MAG: prepilin-type N-terminal cleavage/methylation domain-containing protein [Firmicutes bacterium]|nr:prepilin-type N-terminal cleavage/methylation domain-containing protein [Bacillota bacterium]